MINKIKIFREIIILVPYFFFQKKIRAIFVLFFMLLSSMMEAINVAAIYPVINYGLGFDQNQSVLNFYHFILHFLFSDENLFISSCYMLILVTIITGIAKYLNYYASFSLLRSINRDLQKKIIKKLSISNYSFYIQSQQGKLVHTSTIAVQQALAFIHHVLRAIGDALTAIILLYLMFSLTYEASVGIIIIGIIYLLIVRFFIIKMIHPFGQLATESVRKGNVILNELITGIKTIKVFSAMDNWSKKYIYNINNYVDSQFYLLMGRAVPEITMRSLLFIIISFVGIFVYQESDGNILPFLPLYGTFSLVALRLFPELQKVSVDVMTLVECLPSTKIIKKFLNQNNVEDTSKKLKSVKDFKVSINLEKVSFNYDTNNKNNVLENVNIIIKKNRTTAIVGPSGSGKTTLTSLLVKLYENYNGSIKIDDVEIKELNKFDYLNLIGYVSQETFIFNDTISENIKFGLDHVSQLEIEEASKKAFAHDFITDTENGYATVVGDLGAKLSGGQRQRIAIARAILRKTPIIIFDEATSSLDNLSELKVKEAIDHLQNEKTILIITHKLNAIQNANQIYVINDGRIVESGNHELLISKKQYYFNLYNAKESDEFTVK